MIALTVAVGPLTAHQIAHGEAEGETAVVPSGSAALGPAPGSHARGRTSTVTDWAGWLARGGAELDSASPALLTYSFTNGQTMVVRRPQPTDGHPLKVLVSANIAKAAPTGGLITLNFQDAEVPAQIVGVAKRFPDSNDEGQGFVVAEQSHLATALSADAPGTAVPDELWLSVPGSAAARVAGALTRSPFASLVVASRRDLQHQLDSQPLARGITLTLGAAGLIAVLLAAVGFLLALVSEARDERGELFDLEAQGVSPGTLRNQLRARSLVLVAFGAIAGARARPDPLAARRLGDRRLGRDDRPGAAAPLPAGARDGASRSARARSRARGARRGDRPARVEGRHAVPRLVEPRMTAAIEIGDAFRIYESGDAATVALQGLDLELEAGEIVVALGPSGAGKSTLLRVLAGLERLSAGTARVFGTELGRLDAAGAASYRAAHVGLLDQHYARSLSPDLTCRHTVALQLELLGTPAAESRPRADELLDRVGLLDRAGEPPANLSGGEQQRVAVCAAVAHGPGLLLADEPAGELDAANATVVYELLGGARSRGRRDGAHRQPRCGRGLDRRPARLHPRRPDRRAVAARRQAGARDLAEGLGPPAARSVAAGKPRFAEVEQDGSRIVLTPVSLRAPPPRRRASTRPSPSRPRRRARSRPR